MNFPLNQATMPLVPAGTSGPARGRVTAAALVNSICYVFSPTAQVLTKRRAVDFCRVSTAMCTSRPVPAAA